MRYNQLLGYKDANGQSKPDVIFGPGNDDKVFEAISEAADKHIFPEGYKRIVLVGWDTPLREISFISEEVAVASLNAIKFQKKLVEDERERHRLAQDAQKNFTAANKIFQSASTKRNLAISKQSAAESLLASSTLPEKDRDSQIKKVETAKSERMALEEDFNKNILPHYQTITSRKATLEEKQKAFIALGVIKAPEPISEPK